MATAKSSTRLDVIEKISKVLIDQKIYNTIDYVNKKEDYIKQFLYPKLEDMLKAHYLAEGVQESTADKKAEHALIWEGDKKQTLHNITMFGTLHRPDMQIDIDGISIAVEVKKGDNGSSIRDGFGQCLVYESHYDFVVFLFIDTSPDKKILNSIKGDKEVKMIDQLWDNHNTRALFV